MRIHVIVSSTRQGRVGNGVADWVIKTINTAGHEVVKVDLRVHKLPFVGDESLPDAVEGQFQSPAIQAWSETIATASTIIFVTPEYNHGYPGELKNAIDWLYPEWADKPAAIVSYSSGIGAGIRSAEQLKLVSSKVGLRISRNNVWLPNIRSTDGSDIDDRATDQVKAMLVSLDKLA